MSKPNEKLLQQVLHTDQARAWLDRLTAAFFDRDAKQQLLDAARAGLADLAPGLDADALRQLGDGVIQELCRQASRDARPPRDNAPAVTPLAGHQFEDQVLERYPFPVAVAYRALGEQTSAAAGFGCLLDTFEVLLHYLATVAVSAYLRTDLDQPACNRLLLEMLLKGAWATGDLFALLRETVRLAGDCGGRFPYPMPALLFTPAGRPSASCQVLESFVTLRNRRWGHGTGRTEASFHEILGPNRRRLEDELARMPWLAEWRLIRPVAIDESGRVRSADLLNGCLRKKARPFELALEERDLAGNGGDVRADRDALLLVAPDGQSYLPLFPLSLFQFRASPHGQGSYFLQRSRWQMAPAPWRLSQAVYVAYEDRLQEHEEGPREFVAGSLERHIERLRGRLPAEARPTVQAEEPAGDPDYTLPEVVQEQQSHQRVFVGREEALAQIADWIDRQTEGRYLLLLGPPGQGKSALMAELGRREAQRGGCLLHMVKSHPSPRRFLPALLSQAASLAQARFGAEAYRGDIDDLRNALVKGLEAVRQKVGRAVVVLDALDELDVEGNRVGFLPPSLPQGVRVVVSCRPDIPLVNALRARLHGRLEERTLEPLSPGEFALVLERRLKPDAMAALRQAVDLNELFTRMAGNPLFLHCFLCDLIARWEQAVRAGTSLKLDPVELPTIPEAVFRGIYDHIRDRRSGQAVTAIGRQRALLLQLLCVAREPLALEQLAELATAAGQPLMLEECRDRVEEMSQWLLEAGRGRFKPWHQGLADFVRGQVLGESGIRQWEEVYCRWLERSPDAAGGYGLRHHISHLLAAGRTSDAAALLVDWRWLEAKTEAGLVFELAGDFRGVTEALPVGDERRWLELLEEALRRDIHFLARHPTALFQCLWNSGWWYDCPAAAQHYDVSQRTGHEPLPWEPPGPKLYPLLERWRAAKEKMQPGFVWLRWLRPPALHLGTTQKAVFRGHDGTVQGVAFSPDGRRIASGSDDGTVRVWDTASGAECLCLRGHESLVKSVAISPDGRRIASGSWDRTVRIWDAATGAELLGLRGHKGLVTSVAFSPDGRRVASAAEDQTVCVWNVDNGTRLLCLRGHEGKMQSVSFTSDGRRLVSGSEDRTVRIWDAVSGARLLCLRGHKRIVETVAFSPDGQMIVSGSSDRTVRIWDAVSGTQLLRIPSQETVASVAFSPDGRRIVGGSYDHTVRVWEAAKGAELFCLRGHEGWVTSAAFSPDGRLIVSGSWDRTVRVWNAAGGAELLRPHGHEETVTKVAFSPDGRLLASGSWDRTVRVWDASSGAQLLCLRGHEDWVRSVDFSPDGRRLASGSNDRTIRVWDTTTGAELLCLRGHESWVTGVSFSADGEQITSRSKDLTARVWDARSGACLEAVRTVKDVAPLAASEPPCPWRALQRGLETRIESAITGELVAWLPVALASLAPHRSGHTWAGASGNHLYLFTLEGQPSP